MACLNTIWVWKMKDQKSNVKYYARSSDIDQLPELFRSEVASWLDTDGMVLDSAVGSEYIKVTAEDGEQLEARIDLLENPVKDEWEVDVKQK